MHDTLQNSRGVPGGQTSTIIDHEGEGAKGLRRVVRKLQGTDETRSYSNQVREKGEKRVGERGV